MCGIAGIVNFNKEKVEEDLLNSMTMSLWHRGPDSQEVKSFGNIGLGHCRLSIIDISNGIQPMTNEDSSIWIVFNGEIYNYIERKAELISKGHLFKTNSDTEVIIHAYEEYGYTCLEKLDGMFSFSIFDRNKNILFCARDRFGKKPFYYSFNDREFLFASEIHTIAKHTNTLKEIDPKALKYYFRFNYISATETIYKTIKKLLPAHYLILDINSKKLKVQRYWKLNFSQKQKISYSEAKKHLRYLLEESVRKRLIADVPVGSFLSGGIDSSIVTGIMSKFCGPNLKSFTIGFSNTDFDERKFAVIAARKYKTDHNERLTIPNDFSVVENLIHNYGEPFADSSMLPTYLLSRFAREKVVVALSGDGGDELFAGYYRYLFMRYSVLADYIPSYLKKYFFDKTIKILINRVSDKNIGKIKRVSLALSENYKNRYASICSRCTQRTLSEILGERVKSNIEDSYLSNEIPGIHDLTSKHKIEALLEADIHTYLPNDLLTKVDIASMANSLEVRNPLLDHKLAEFVASLPFGFKQSLLGRKKAILIDSCKDILPKEIINRKKMGFAIPLNSWIRNEWKEEITDLVLNSKSIQDGYFNKKSIENIYHEHMKYKNDYGSLIYALIVFELWYRNSVKTQS